jgi:uncharacterized delta-60 repeat protein
MKTPRRYRFQPRLLSLEARLTPAVQLDAAFGSGGLVTTRFPVPSDEFGSAVVIDQQGRILVAGSSSGDFLIERYGTDGTLDKSFGNAGNVLVDFGTPLDGANGITVDSLGRIVVVGNDLVDIAVARLNDTGALDTTFASSGKLTLDYGSNSEYASAVTTDSQGRILLAGNTNPSSYFQMIAIRLTAAGALDTSFDTDGSQLIDFGGNTHARAVTVDSSDRVIVAGFTVAAGTNANDFAVARLLTNGALDTTFSADGKQTVNFGGNGTNSQANAVRLTTSGDILLAGSSGGNSVNTAVAALTSTGALDANFGSGGKVQFFLDAGSTNTPCNAMALDSQGRLVLGGSVAVGSNTDFVVARLLSSGAMDAAFNNGGDKVIPFGVGSDACYGLAIDSSDRVVVAGETANGTQLNDVAVGRLASTGALDSTFGVGGKQITSLMSDSFVDGNAVAMDSSGRMVVAARVRFDDTSTSATPSVFGVLRYTSNGSLDTSFGVGGMVTIDFGQTADCATAVTFDSSGRILVAGTANGASAFAVARLLDSGMLDPTFGTGGKTTVGSLSSVIPGGIKVDSQGRIVIGGAYQNNIPFGGIYYRIAASRLLVNGQLDLAFGAGGTQTHDLTDPAPGSLLTGVGVTSTAITVDALDRVLVAGQSTYHYTNGISSSTHAFVTVVRFSNAGVEEFTRNAPFSTLLGGIATDSQNRIIVSGGDGTGTMVVARYTSAGDLDTTFDSDGVASMGYVAGPLTNISVAVDRFDRVIVAGAGNVSGSNLDAAVARFTVAGAIDTVFNGIAPMTIDFGSTNDIANDVLVDSFGRIILVGKANYSYSQSIELARLTTSDFLLANVDGSGNLVVTDANSPGVPVNMTLAADTVNNVYRIDADAIIESSIAGAGGVHSNSVTIPFAAITGSKLLVNLTSGADTVTIDWSKGNFSKNISVTGSSGMGDQLKVAGGSFSQVTDSITNFTDGSLTLTPANSDPARTISYAAQDGVNLSSITVADLVFPPSAKMTDPMLGDDAFVNNGASLLSSPTNAIVPTIVGNPTHSLTLNGISNGSVSVGSLSDLTSSLILGTAASPFANVSFSGVLTLGPDSSLTANATTVISCNASADVTVQGTGSITLTTKRNISMTNGSLTSANGSIALSANQQSPAAAGAFSGIIILGTVISSTGGNITLLGRGGSSGSSVVGVLLGNSGKITGGGAGTTLTITGTGGTSTTSGAAVGINVAGGSSINTTGGASIITGVGGGTTATTTNSGITIGGQILTGGAGLLTVNGLGGPNSNSLLTTNNHGILLTVSTSMIATGGALNVTGTEGGGICFGIEVSNGKISGAGVTLATDLFDISNTATITAGANTLTIHERSAGKVITLGSAGSGLNLTDAQLDRCFGSTLALGDSQAGNLTVNAAITRTAATNMQLVSGSNIIVSPGSVNTHSGTLMFSPGASGSVQPTSTGTDVTASTTSFAAGSNLALTVNGTTSDSGYRQLNVAGGIDLSGANLSLSGSYVPVLGDKFSIVANDGSDAVAGTFNGLPEGALVSFGTVNLTITYKGGDGNDVVLAVLPTHVVSVQVNDGSAQRSRVTSLAVTFDSNVSLPAIKSDAFQLTRQSDSAAIGLKAAQSGSVVTLTFTAGPAVDFGSLADGRYTLKVLAAKVNGGNFDGNNDGTTGDDYQLIGDPATNKLYRFYGDIDGDGAVSTSDFIIFRQAFNSNLDALDFDNDGAVSTSDFIQFRQRFNGSI